MGKVGEGVDGWVRGGISEGVGWVRGRVGEGVGWVRDRVGEGWNR